MYWIYITTNRTKSVLYTGVTNNLLRRIHEHKNSADRHRFATRYRADVLVYFEQHNTVYDALRREKQIKAGPRRRKVKLIETINPYWHDLTGRIIEHYQ